jgi:hypothetical protein
MPRFEIGARVVVRGEPERRGTVKQVKEDAAEPDYQISWDDKVVGTRAEHELMPAPGSHTDQPQQ